MKGVWLPIITPFKNGEVDYISYSNLIKHYMDTGITGIIPLGTTGECPTIEPQEFEKIIEKTVETVNGKIPVFAGVGGNYTKKVALQIKNAGALNIDGILSVCPYYNKPNQQGLYEHFKALSESTSLPIIIYNIPYRTGINMSNETLFRLAELKNIIGVKDSCADMNQSVELIKNKPNDFYAFTGDDIFFFHNLANGGDGGIMASAHLYTRQFIKVFNSMQENDYFGALAIWKTISTIIPYLFKEPNPAPLKYCLKKMGMIASDEVRLPLISISKELQAILDNILHS